ncbi:MAG: 3-keto-5-aminohexanoate cleavage protein, partial [bacterium]
HTLDADAYRAAVAAIRARVGDDLFIQITSEAAGVYVAARQREAIAALGDDDVDGVSIALRELLRDDADFAPACALFERLARRGVLIQYIVYGEDDIARYASLLKQQAIPPARHSLLLVIGRYGEQPSTPDALRRMVEALARSESSAQWMACAFGEREFDCLAAAAELGGHVRVGFENSLRLKGGRIAADNRELVAQWSAPDRRCARPLADVRQARAILGADE